MWLPHAGRGAGRANPLRRQAKRNILMLMGLLSWAGCASLQLPVARRGNDSPVADSSTLTTRRAKLLLQAAQSSDRQGKIDQAIRLYEQAQAVDAQADAVTHRLAMLYDQQGDDVRAQDAYERAVARNPQDPDLHNDMGMYHRRRGQFKEAEACFLQALQLQPTHARARNNLGIVLAMQGRLSESLAAFSQVSGAAVAHYNLSAILLQQGQTDLARHHLHRSLQEDPSLVQAATLLAQLDDPPFENAAASEHSSTSLPGTNPHHSTCSIHRSGESSPPLSPSTVSCQPNRPPRR
ncbi:MAG: hypothetical protein KatS3mg111_1881 [Pirellulaceae bacterium]|nr:MAG: hypothetical protein KatS3mg111_1881 [Pirellulaceae bacterium]